MIAAHGLPARPTWYVGRAGVFASLDNGPWLTSVIAAAGAGKTTAVGGWAAGRQAAWLSLRPDDAELSVLRPRLADATRAAGMREDLSAIVGDTAGPPVDGADNDHARADALASLLASTVDQVGVVQDNTIVLDGFERLPPSSASVRFIEALSRHAPPGLRLVIVSREQLPFPAQRLGETGRFTELTAADLAFGVDETYQLLTIALGDAAAADEIASDLHTLTSGWPSQVSLGAAWLAQQPAATRRARLASFGGFNRELAESILANTPSDARELIRAAAYLPRVDRRLPVAIGLTAATVDMASLLARCAPMLMPESGRPDWFRVSSVTRTAVHAKSPLDATRRRVLLSDAARWFAEHGELDSALTAAVELGDPDVLTWILDVYGSELIGRGRSIDVIAAVDRIPPPARTRAVRLVEGEARHSRGDIAGSLVCLGSIDDDRAEFTPALARRIGRIRQVAGDIAGAADLYARTKRDGSQPVDEAIMVGQMAAVHWLRGDIDRARTVVDEAVALAEACGDESALANAYATAAMIAERDGDFVANDEYTDRASAAATAGGDLIQLTRIRINRSQRLLQHGNFADALVEIDEALRLTEVTGTGGWFGSIARTNRGWAYRGLGRFDEALAEFGLARDFWHAAGSDLVAYAKIGLGATYLDRGDVESADAELTAALGIGERSGDHQAMTGLATLARARYATDPAAAWRLIERSLATALGHWRNWALLTVGWLALCEGDATTATKQAAETMANLERFPDPCAVAEATELGALAMTDHAQAVAALADAQRQWARIGNPVFVNRTAVALAHRAGTSIVAAEARLRAIGVRPAAATAAGPLRVVGAFAYVTTDTDRLRFVAAAREALARFDEDTDVRRARAELTDAMALLAGTPTSGSELRGLYVSALDVLARACEQAGEVDAAVAWRLRVLEDDPFDEGGHLGVVGTLARAGRHAEARRRYRVYIDRMRQRGREPAPYPSEVDSPRG